MLLIEGEAAIHHVLSIGEGSILGGLVLLHPLDLRLELMGFSKNCPEACNRDNDHIACDEEEDPCIPVVLDHGRGKWCEERGADKAHEQPELNKAAEEQGRKCECHLSKF